MKNFFLNFLVCIAAALALLGCGGGGGGHGGGNGPSAPIGVSVTLDGDSVLFGLDLAVPPAQVLRNAGFVVVDKTAAGLTLRALVHGYEKPFEGALPQYYPNGPQPSYERVARSTDVVVLAAGGNDALSLLGVADYEALLRQAVDILRAEGRAIVLTGIVQTDDRHSLITPQVLQRIREFNEVQRRVAAEYSIEHAGWDVDYQGLQDSADGIHRTQAASDRLTNRLAYAVHRAAVRNLFGGVA